LESISDTPDGLDQFGFVFELLPESPDMNVNRSLQRIRVFASTSINQFQP